MTRARSGTLDLALMDDGVDGYKNAETLGDGLDINDFQVCGTAVTHYERQTLAPTMH